LKVISLLREAGYTVLSITESNPGVEDIDILDLAAKNGSLVLTFDKDFGELVFQGNRMVAGVILLRFKPESVSHITERILKTLMTVENIKEHCFTVVEENKIRIRKL
jgi:predicted nuclease of predicted toxin-antitoxin system